MLQLAWSQYIQGSPNFLWQKKLKRTKLALKSWVKASLNTPTRSKQERVLELSEFQLEMEVGDITKAQLVLEHSTQLKTSLSFQQEEDHLRLKSRSL